MATPRSYAAPVAAISAVRDNATRATLQALLDSLARLSADLGVAAFNGVQMSLVVDASGIKLSGDATAPGNNKVYGTNAGGVKGWKADVAGAGVYTIGRAMAIPRLGVFT